MKVFFVFDLTTFYMLYTKNWINNKIIPGISLFTDKYTYPFVESHVVLYILRYFFKEFSKRISFVRNTQWSMKG